MKIYKIIFIICFVNAVCLLVAGFLAPPTGIIDGSVLTAVGEIFAFATLSQLPALIHGRSVNLSHGKTTLTLGDDDEKHNESNIDNDKK